ncbi:CHAP domain-containing protein [Pedobacter sp. LMG 31462]|uniref:CHAP domain-containing protein n=1 Tax=Pedobacter gandavensis TaxID=2679963 RepID=A0ABR6EW27_9SPHI|nr:CHAP domain-containing protein [Pedobacter gandavensis]
MYESQIGVRELTGKNDGKSVEAYLKYVGLGKGYAWCAAFTCWTLNQASIKNPKSAWSPDMFPSANVIYSKTDKENITPEQGDVFGIYFPDKKRIAHVGFIHKWGKSEVITVEGNTNQAGSREGDGVYRKRRITGQIYKVSRFIR